MKIPFSLNLITRGGHVWKQLPSDVDYNTRVLFKSLCKNFGPVAFEELF